MGTRNGNICQAYVCREKETKRERDVYSLAASKRMDSQQFVLSKCLSSFNLHD